MDSESFQEENEESGKITESIAEEEIDEIDDLEDIPQDEENPEEGEILPAENVYDEDNDDEDFSDQNSLDEEDLEESSKSVKTDKQETKPNKILQNINFTGINLEEEDSIEFLQKFDSESKPSLNPMCGIFKFMDDEYYRPTISTYFLTFTLFFSLVPMLMSGNTNYFFISLIIFLLVSDTVTKFSFQCVNLNGVFLSIVTGVLLGCLSAFGIYSMDPELLFFGGLQSNNVTCNKPNKKTFKCSVYKNGQLLKTL